MAVRRDVRYVLAFLLAASPAAFSFPALAEGPTCDIRHNVMKVLEGKYGEKPVAIGVANNGGVIEVLTTEDGGTWTIVITLPNGMTCLVAAGEDWESFPKATWGKRT